MPERLQDPGGSLLRILERADVRNVTCVVLSKHFKVLQFSLSSKVNRTELSISSLLFPHYAIASEARRFLHNIQLHGRPFVGIHLRQTDFLTWGEHKSFAKACNNNPDLILRHLRSVERYGIPAETRPSFVLATDDYFSPCSQAVIKATEHVEVVSLSSASPFKRGSCEEASFDQEVLGASNFFIGDGTSTFSDAIRLIRTNRYRYSHKSNYLFV
jgi:hypothetical protein